MKKFLIVLCLLLLLSCSKSQELSLAGLKGPTSMGLVYTRAAEDMQLLSSPDEMVGKITSGEVDLAMLPLNMAGLLYNKTQGEIRLLAINTLGNLYLCGEPLEDIAHLEGKSILSAGQNATPMYLLELLLEGMDTRVDYLPSHGDVVAAASENRADYYLLPEPFVSIYISKLGGGVAMDLAEVYKERTGQPLTMGALVTTRAALEKKSEEISSFMEDYKKSIERVLRDPDDASQLIEDYGIVDSRELARSSIEGSGLAFYRAPELREAIDTYFKLLMDNNPKALGGEYPGEDFYADF